MKPLSDILRTAIFLTLLLGLGISLAGPSHGASRNLRHVPTPPDSYLQYRVYTVDQLIQQVQERPVVRARFARHFHIPEDRVVSYMRANLVESYIPRTGRYTVYCVRRSGRFYPVRQRFQRGTKVFALRNGQPVLKWLCGNPLTKFLPAVTMQTTIEKLPVVKVSPSIEMITPTETAEILIPNETPQLQPVVPLVGPSFAAASVPVFSGGGGSLFPFLLPLGLLGFHSGGGGSTFVPIIPPAAIPEAGTWAYLAAGLTLLGWAQLRRRAARHAGD